MEHTYQVVLDDGLYKEYHAYKSPKSGKPFSQDKIARILKFSGGSVLTNYAQYVRTIDQKDDNKMAILLKDYENKDKSLENLVRATNYKIILTDDKSKKKYPYVNIDGDEIDMVLGGFIMRGESRKKALEHIKNLCAEANTILIYDSYFCGSDAKTKNNVKTLTDILPKDKKIEIIYHKEPGKTSHFSQDCINLIKSNAPEWSISDRKLPDHHDRYLVINDKTEIILTSGFDQMYNSNKEISYIVHNYGQRFT